MHVVFSLKSNRTHILLAVIDKAAELILQMSQLKLLKHRKVSLFKSLRIRSVFFELGVTILFELFDIFFSLVS